MSIMATFNDVLQAAETLPIDDRLRLVGAVWDTIACAPVSDWPAPSDEWIAECQRRSAAYDAGEISASPWPEALARAERRAGLDG
jgi:putative addiction module component (TIGR02574 family)